MQTQDPQPALPFRSHTILGVCEAIGEDFGFNPVWLRVPFAATVLLNPMMSIAAYLALGLVVLASRLLFPKSAARPAVIEAARADDAIASNDEAEQEKLPIAA